MWQNIKFLFLINSWGHRLVTHTYMYTYIHTCIHTYIHTYIHVYIYTYIHGSKVINFCIELYTSFEHMEKLRHTPTFHQSQRQASKQAEKRRSSGASRACCSILGGGGGCVDDLLWLVLSSLYPTLFSTLSGSLFLYKPISSSPLHTHLFSLILWFLQLGLMFAFCYRCV